MCLTFPLRFILPACLLALLPALIQAGPLRVTSPDGNLVFVVASNTSGHLAGTITRKGRTVVESALLGIVVDGQDLGAQATLGRAKPGQTRETYPMFGGHAQAINRSRDAFVPVTSGAGRGAWTLEVRVFDDGVAWRYRVPGTGVRQINGESTAWTLPPGATLWYQDNVKRDYESPYRTAPVANLAAQLKPGTGIMTTSLVRLAGDPLYVMMTEGNLINYSDMALAATAPNTFAALFHNSPGGWAHEGEIVSPWRVTIVAADLNTLVNTDIIRNVCPPPAPELAGAGWIRPGRATWHWMITRGPKLNQQRQWIDWTKQLGFDSYIIDDGWIRWTNGGKDAWTCLKETVDYATAQGVRIWAWTHSKELLTPEARAAYFQKARAAGVVGLKIDFMKPADAWWVQWYDDTLREAAAAKLLVNFHGCLKPTGRERTWPNNLTREAIRGREARKQPGLHDTTLPFTRFVQGPADYTPVDFRAGELRGNSYAHELAQAVVYTSPLFVYSGSPADYLASEALDLMKAIPPAWDETLVLPGSSVGEVAAYARRRGSEWFIAAVNGAAARKMEVSLKFLGRGTYRLDQFADDPSRNDGWIHTQATVKRGHKLALDLRADGGFIARLSPAQSERKHD